ncbi:MAG: RluA family pseudouridine synthase [Clostridiales bacterium]|jgi:23S rRNA pseudouridine1911/1915/1917 synthase|nr:RluA family pseudouridine synthase [Clostridiales bacterium]
MIYEFTVDGSRQNTRLDVFAAEKADGLTRSQIKSLIDSGKLLVNGRAAAKGGYVLRAGDAVRVETETKTPSAAPEEIALDIVYEDEFFAVINKPQGMVVHPARGSLSGTLVNALLYKMTALSSLNGDAARPGIVHRLDKDTSGLIAVAKTDAAHLSLSKQIADKSALRYYTAVLDGVLKPDEGVIETFIGRSQSDRTKMAVTKEGRRAVTLFKVTERFAGFTLVEFELKTGRTHQIRVHSKHIGHPVTGDKTYGGSQRFKTDGQLLHASRLVLRHPATGVEMQFFAPLPEYFEKVIALLKKGR